MCGAHHRLFNNNSQAGIDISATPKIERRLDEEHHGPQERVETIDYIFIYQGIFFIGQGTYFRGEDRDVYIYLDQYDLDFTTIGFIHEYFTPTPDSERGVIKDQEERHNKEQESDGEEYDDRNLQVQ